MNNASRSFGSTLVAIAWSFAGLRRKKDFDQDVRGLNPIYVVIAGLLGTGLFIACLITAVHFAVK